MSTPLSILRQYWGFESFRPLQADIIQSVLEGKDTLALLPTGGGKSLCYQVPGLVQEGLCLVISPLIALMKDQVENLRKKQITAYALFAGMSRREVIRTLEVAAQSNCRFLYVSPERLETSLFKEYLPALDIRLIAVDEAHCISQWGYDFRPPYLRIAALREEYPEVPILALTASATPEVQQDILDKLRMPAATVFRQPFLRPNLSYSVFQTDAKINRMAEILQKVPGSAIVYARSRRRCEEFSRHLQQQGMEAGFYHAGLSSEERSARQEAWIRNQLRVMVCTNAFGMGIDKPDVRIVIHADPPESLEHYYQEAGRAGRDGKKSYAVLLYEPADLKSLEALKEQRFPGPDEIRNVYQAIANYLQLPVGSGEGQYVDFDFAHFRKQFNLEAISTLQALQVLGQEGWMSFNEQVFLPARAQVLGNRESLQQFEQAYPALDPLLKTLLRTYEGILDFPVPVSERQLAGILKTPVEQIREGMASLQRLGMADWQPVKDSPQLYIHRSRIRAEELRPDVQAMELRKARYQARLEKMIHYIRDNHTCRSQLIARYFGEQESVACGVCDTCLEKKRKTLSAGEFETAWQQVQSLLKEEAMPVRQLLQRLTGLSDEKAREVLDILRAEEKIESTADGRVRLK